MTAKPAKQSAVPAVSALDSFFQSLESRTADANHLRLLKAARKPDVAAALEKELGKIMEELLHEA